MGFRQVKPNGKERFFAEDEIIVSKTDLKGIITYTNDVFIRVAGYQEGELIGAPHSIIRHPDMPRCVFQLLWDTIEAGREIFAYVVNLAAMGEHYWVLAHVTPTFGPDGRVIGYHSNRRVPAREAVAKIVPIYRALCAEEAKHERKADAIRASTKVLTDTLAGAGMTYDEFVWSLTNSTIPSGVA